MSRFIQGLRFNENISGFKMIKPTSDKAQAYKEISKIRKLGLIDQSELLEKAFTVLSHLRSS